MRISAYLLIPFISWAISQLLKYLLNGLKSHNLKNLSYLYSSGDMPSSHAALVVSLLVTVGAREGLQSAIFGVVAAISTIVLYDSLNVRRAVGEQAQVIKKLLANAGIEERFHFAKGHTVIEVLAGTALGAIVAIIMLQFL